MGRNLIRILTGVQAIVVLFIIHACSPDNLDGTTFTNRREPKAINKIYAIADEAERLWPGYSLLKTEPLILLFNDGGTTRAYLLNATGSLPAGSIHVNSSAVAGKIIYRCDPLVEEIESANDGFIALFGQVTLGGQRYYFASDAYRSGNPYFSFANRDDNFFPLLAVHEMFHYYQFDYASWDLSAWRQDYFGFPQTKEIIELSLLLFDTMMDAYNGEQSVAFLEKYVSIRAMQMQVDPSAEQLIQHQAVVTDAVEGSARYVEQFSALRTVYPNINHDPTHTMKAQLDTVTNAILARQILVQRVPYHVGAIAIKILIDSGVNVQEALRQGETPYSLARAYLGKTDDYYDQVLFDLIAGVDWPAYQARAAVLEGILN